MPTNRRSFITLSIILPLSIAGCTHQSLASAQAQPSATATPANTPIPSPANTPIPTPTDSPPSLGRLAFIRAGDVWVEDLPTGAARRLTSDGHDETPRWSPSGDWLAFLRLSSGAATQLWTVRASTGEARRIDGANVDEGDRSTTFAWSPVEDSLAYVAHGSLYVEDAAGSNRRQIFHATDGKPFTGVTSLAWSHDGQWLAVVDDEPLPPGPSVQVPQPHVTLWRVRADGSQKTVLLDAGQPSPYGMILAGWSPDGSHVLYWGDPGFSASLLADGTGLMAVPAAGGTPIQVVQWMLAYHDFLTWSPNGQQLAIVQGSGRAAWAGKGVTIASLGRGSQQLADPGRADLYPSWSPDGHSIAFTSSPAAPNAAGEADAGPSLTERRIWLSRPDGTDRRQLTAAPGVRDESPHWSADGRFVLFARLRGDGADLVLTRADGSDQGTVVASLSPSPRALGYYGYIPWGRLYDWWNGWIALWATADAGAVWQKLPMPEGAD